MGESTDSAGVPLDPTTRDARGTACALLMSFLGAAMASPFCLRSFVSLSTYAYLRGWSAKGIFSMLRERDFVEVEPGPGQRLLREGSAVGFVSVAGVEQGASAGLMSLWLGCVYVALAQLGVPRPPGAASEDGWAWVMADGTEGSMEAWGNANFVAGVLARLAEEREAEGSLDSGEGGSTVSDMAEQRQPAPGGAAGDLEGGTGAVSVADPFLEEESPSLFLMRAQATLVELVRDEVDVLAAVASQRRGGADDDE